MIAGALLLAQIAALQLTPADSNYATPALRLAVEAAAAANREAPSTLRGYRAHLESEIGLLIVDTLGRERVAQVEQLGTTASWSRDSGYVTHVSGYRTQSAGVPISMVGLFNGWSLPMLYGERLLIGIEGSRTRNVEVSGRGRARDSVVAIHPFAADRDHYYRYSGGDTVAVINTARRRIPLLRIRVIPNLELGTRFSAFDGEIDLDAESFAIVRMRGEFVVSKPTQPSGTARLIIAGTGTVGVAYAEFINGEYDGRYWLPSTQRIEFQAKIALFGGMRSAVRVVSRFSDFALDETPAVPGDAPVAAYSRREVTFAPADSMSAFGGWQTQLGEATSSVTADDFMDIAPPSWNGTGPPGYSLFPTRPERIIHYDRIEGLFTGAELTAEMRDAAPGVVARAYGGWAWAERTARGGISLTKKSGLSTSAVHLNRSLVSTADFRGDLEGGGESVSAFLASIEDVDYVDRWTALAAETKTLGSTEHALVFGQLGIGRDVNVVEALTHGPIRQSVLFRPNRHAATGNYAIAMVDYEFHPNVSGEFLEPGIGSTLHVEGAVGQLSWVRTEATASARRNLGPITLAARMEGGALFSPAPPPQQLFEIGGSGVLDGYQYKQFAGDRAAIFRGYALYGLPIFRAPYRIKRLLIPGLTPGFGAGIDGAWTGISTDAARRAVLALGDGTVANAVSQATGRIRTTASIGLTFFDHSLHVAMSRPIDEPARWRWIVGLGQGF